MANRLEQLMQEHMAMPFPESITKGLDYGEIEPVLIGADVYGWASGVASGTPLDEVRRSRLQAAHDELLRSMDALPEPARPYYELIARLAKAALTHDPSA